MHFYIKYIGKLTGRTNEFQQSMVFKTDALERPKFDCINQFLKNAYRYTVPLLLAT